MQHTIRVFLITSMILGISAVVLNAAVDNPYFHKILGKFINETVENTTHAKLEFHAVSLQFFPPGFDMYGISLKDQEQHEIASTSRVQVRVSILSLILGKPRLGLLQFNELRTSYPFPNNILKDDAIPKSKDKSDIKGIQWPPPMTLPIDTLAITDSTFHVRIPSKSKGDTLAAQLDGVNFELDYSDWDDWSTDITISRVNVLSQDTQFIRDAKFDITIQSDDNRIYSRDLSIVSNRLNVVGDATLDLKLVRQKMNLFRGRRLVNYDLTGMSIYSDLKLISGDIGILADFLGVKNSSGKLKGAIKYSAQIPLNKEDSNWTLNGTISSLNAQLDGFKLLHSDMDFSIDRENLYFDQFQVRPNKESQSAVAIGKGKISFKKGTAFNFDLNPISLPFSTLMKILKVDDYRALEAILDSPKLKISGQVSPFKIEVSGPIDFSQMTLPNIKDSPFLKTNCFFDASFTISPQKVLIPENIGKCMPSAKQGPAMRRALSKMEGIPDNLYEMVLQGAMFFDNKKGMDLKFSSSKVDGESISHFIQNSVTGKWKMTTRIHGPYNDLKLSSKASADESTFYGFKAKKSATKIRFDTHNGVLNILDFKLNEDKDKYLRITNGKMTFSPLRFSGSFSGKNTSPEFMSSGLSKLFPDQGVSFGVKEIQGTVDFELDKPFLWQGLVTGSINNGTKDGNKFFSLIKGTVSANDEAVTSKNLYLRLDLLEAMLNYHEKRTPAVNINENFWQSKGLNLDNPIALSLKTINDNANNSTHKGFDDLNHLSSIPIIGSPLKRFQFGSDINVNSELEGTFRKLQGSFKGSLERLVAFGSPLAPLQFSGFVDGSKISIPVIKHAGNSLVGRLNFDFLEKGIPYEWQFYLEQFDARAFFSPFFAQDPRNYAYLTAEWNMNGNFSSWWDSSGKLTIKKIESQFVQKSNNQLNKIQLNTDESIAMSFKKQGWLFENKKALTLKGKEFELELSLDKNNPPDDLNINTRGVVDLVILKKLIPVVETAKGKLQFNGYIRGAVENPDINISISDQKLDPLIRSTWQPVTIGIVDFAPSFTELSIDAAFRGDKIQISDVSGKKGARGQFKIKGNWDLKSDRREDSQIFINFTNAEMQRISVPIFKSADATLSGDIVLTGKDKPFLVAGNVSVVEASTQTDFDIRKQIVSSIQQSKFTAPSTLDSPTFKFDVSISNDKNILIKNKNMNVQLSSDLTIRGDEQKPIILGQIESNEGTFNYRRDFKIQRGILSFEEPTFPSDPRIDVIGEAEILTEGTNYVVQVIVNGKVSNPSININVDPPTKPDGTAFSKIDTILLLTTGRLPSSDSNTPNFLENEALSLFFGYAEGPLEKIFDLTGQQHIRQIYLDTYLPEAEGSQTRQPVPRLNLPVRITDDLSLILQLDTAENMKASFQYALHKKITVSGSFDDSNKKNSGADKANLPADTAIDLKFKFNFE